MQRGSLARAVLGLLLIGGTATAAAQPPAQPGPPTPLAVAAITPIPIPEIAQRAEQVVTLLRMAEESMADATAHDVEAQLAATADWIHPRLVSTGEALASSPSANALAYLADSWQMIRTRLVGLNDTLTRRATVVQQRLEQIEAMRATWAATQTFARDVGAPPTVLERIEDTLAAIAAARRAADARLVYVLGLQDGVAKQMVRCDDVLARIAASVAGREGGLLHPSALPIWSPDARAQMSSDVGRRLRESLQDTARLTRDFVVSQRARVPLQIGLFVIVLVLALRARRAARRRTNKEPSEAAVAQVFELPLSSAFAVALIATVWIYPQPPRPLMNAVGLLVLLPAVRIVRRLASPTVVPAVNALAAFFLVDRVRDVCSAVPVLEQWVFLLEMLSGIVFLALTVRSERRLSGCGNTVTFAWRPVVAWILWGQLAVLVVGVSAGALGYMRLAGLFGSEVLTSSYVALVLYAGVRVGEGLLAYVLRARPLRNVLSVQRHRAVVQRRLTLGLHALALVTWAYSTLDGVGLMSPLWAAGTAAMEARYVRGSVSLSLGDVAAFVLTVAVAFLLSALVRVVLQEDVYPRLRLPLGAAYAVSTILHYILVLVGFVVAVAALGIDLTRVTILAGALGVGVGIGLQGVVANFVSGLILLLERRLHVGDAVQMGTLQGQIREIGARATTIRTWDGADVIIPNATLTSERVVNWTLSDRLRRVDLELGVAYESDPERVLTILRAVAEAQPRVLADPAPVVLCTGFGEGGALKFQVRVWSSIEDTESLLSQLVVALHAALLAAKIEIALPQRAVHIRDGER